MNEKSYWIRVYDIVFTCVLISSIIYTITTTKSLGIIFGNTLVVIILIFGLQFDYYLYKIGDIKKFGNKLIAIMSFFMTITSYGIISEFVNLVKNNFVFSNAIILLFGLAGWGAAILFAVIYYEDEINSYIKKVKDSKIKSVMIEIINRLLYLELIFIWGFIFLYINEKFIPNLKYCAIISFIIIVIIGFFAYFMAKREKNSN